MVKIINAQCRDAEKQLKFFIDKILKKKKKNFLTKNKCLND